MNQVLDILGKAMDAVGGIEGSVGIIAVVLEALLRIIPSQKPLSIMYWIGDGVKMIGQVLSKGADLCIRLGSLLDKILPQRLK